MNRVHNGPHFSIEGGCTWQYARSKRVLSAASASMLGDLISGEPYTPSCGRRSSAMIQKMLRRLIGEGGGPGGGCGGCDGDSTGGSAGGGGSDGGGGGSRGATSAHPIAMMSSVDDSHTRSQVATSRHLFAEGALKESWEARTSARSAAYRAPAGCRPRRKELAARKALAVLLTRRRAPLLNPLPQRRPISAVLSRPRGDGNAAAHRCRRVGRRRRRSLLATINLWVRLTVLAHAHAGRASQAAGNHGKAAHHKIVVSDDHGRR